MKDQAGRGDIDLARAGNGAAPALQAAARSVRNSVADNRRIGFGRIIMALRAQPNSGYHARWHKIITGRWVSGADSPTYL